MNNNEKDIFDFVNENRPLYTALSAVNNNACGAMPCKDCPIQHKLENCKPNQGHWLEKKVLFFEYLVQELGEEKVKRMFEDFII
jgi:hypothetical protein